MKKDVDSRPRLGYDDTRIDDQKDIETKYEEQLAVSDGDFGEKEEETEDIEKKYEGIIWDNYLQGLVKRMVSMMKKNVDTFWKCDIVIGMNMKMNTTSERIKALSPVSGNPRSVESCLWHKDYNQFDRNGRSGG